MENAYKLGEDGKYHCRCTTRQQQLLCQLGSIDQFDDTCQYYINGICALGGKKVLESGHVVPVNSLKKTL